METLQLLQQRVSVSKLTEPVPPTEALIQVFAAAIRAADHGKLQPWRFLVIEGQGLEQLADIYVAAAKYVNPEVSPAVLEKAKKMPTRAPMIIVAIARYQENPGVPQQEQTIACGAATQNLLNALFALGYGAIWRSGDMISNPYVREQLEIQANEEIIGFVYVGTPAQGLPPVPEVDPHQFFKPWPAK